MDEATRKTATPEHRRLIPTDVPGVYKRGGRFVAITRYKGKQVKTYHRSKAEARAAKARRDAGEAPGKRERFEAYAERWLSTYQGRKATGITEGTRADYAFHMRTYAIPYFKGRTMADLGPLDVRHFIEHLTKLEPKRAQKGATRLSPATIRRILCPVKAMLAEAHELEVTRTDCSRVRIVVPAEERTRPPRHLSPAQLGAVLGALTERDRLLFTCLSYTGLRIGEALGLQWRDLAETPAGSVIDVRRQFYRGELRERTKTAESARIVAVHPELARALKRHRLASAYSQPEHPIFASLAGKHQDDHNVRRRLRPAARAAGVPWVTPHVFRHTLATMLRDQGYDTDVIAEVLGHTDEAFTRRTYIHRKAAPRFDDLAPIGLSVAG
jgi:integrase